MDKVIRVATVEDEKDFRQHLERLLSSTNGPFKLSGSFDSAEAAMEEVKRRKPHVVLVDIALPRLSGIECVRALSPCLPKTQFMMLTALDSSDHVFESLRAGATGYLLKRDVLEKLYTSIIALHEGGSPMTNSIARKVTLEFRRFSENPETLSKLTTREEEILRGVAHGKTNKELATKFGVQPSTIETHLHNIYKKLHVNSRQEAARKLRGSSQ